MNRGRGPDPNVMEGIAEARRHLLTVSVEMGLAAGHIGAGHGRLVKLETAGDMSTARNALRGAQRLLVIYHDGLDPIRDLLAFAEAWL